MAKLITNIYIHSFFRITLSLTDKIFICNENWQKCFTHTNNILERYHNKVIALPNGVDTTVFKPNTIKRDTDTLIFVSILDIHHQFKGLGYLLDSVKQIAKKNPNIKLIVVGEGKLKEYYQNKVKQEGYEKNIDFVGAKSQDELVNLYNRSQIFILPSIDTEGFGVVAIEAMACGLPVVVTNIVGVAQDVTDNNCGIAVVPRNSQVMANAINKLLSDDKLAKTMGKNGKKLVEKKYAWSKIATTIENTYKKVLQ